MTLPKFYDNGTPAARRAEGYQSAYQAVELAMQAVKSSAADYRDYDPDQWVQAAREHAYRLRRLAEVMDELETLAAYCLDVAGAE